MRDKIKVKRSTGFARDFLFTDGPNEGRTMFTISVEDGAKMDRSYGMIPRVICKCGVTVLHFHNVEIVRPQPKNVAVIKSECGQSTEVKLQIDEGQTISEVTVRGVKYVPA